MNSRNLLAIFAVAVETERTMKNSADPISANKLLRTEKLSAIMQIQ